MKKIAQVLHQKFGAFGGKNMTDHFRDLPGATDIHKPSTLNPGDSLYSATRAFRLIMQQDGNLVLYAIDDAKLPAMPAFLGSASEQAWIQLSDVNQNANIYTAALWTSKTSGNPGSTANLQSDGHFTVNQPGGGAIWNSPNPVSILSQQAFLRCQDDGNLVLYTIDGGFLWSTQTNARK
jgi:hypothetical protein